MIGDLTTRSLTAALDGLAQRRRAAEANIANVETPGYTAVQVRFEEALAKAIEDGDPRSAGTTVERSLEPTRVNGNNVQIDEEMVGLTETALRQQLVVEALNAKYRVLRTSITGQ